MDCRWNITSNAWVELTYDRFDMELFDDYQTVYDGASLSAPVIGRFSGSKRPLPLISSSTNLYVRFTTDAAQNKQYKGFRANYRGKMRFILMMENIVRTEVQTKKNIQHRLNLTQVKVKFEHFCALITA